MNLESDILKQHLLNCDFDFIEDNIILIKLDEYSTDLLKLLIDKYPYIDFQDDELIENMEKEFNKPESKNLINKIGYFWCQCHLHYTKNKLQYCRKCNLSMCMSVYHDNYCYYCNEY
jgi:hypothetical protein